MVEALQYLPESALPDQLNNPEPVGYLVPIHYPVVSFLVIKAIID